MVVRNMGTDVWHGQVWMARKGARCRCYPGSRLETLLGNYTGGERYVKELKYLTLQLSNSTNQRQTGCVFAIRYLFNLARTTQKIRLLSLNVVENSRTSLVKGPVLQKNLWGTGARKIWTTAGKRDWIGEIGTECGRKGVWVGKLHD